jgi:hypothetical protein
VYVDKTPWAYRLAKRTAQYLLSRPRRFGKSLMISTLKELFSGDRALFQGLWIEPHLAEIEPRPVLHISFNSLSYKDLGLEAAILQELEGVADREGIRLKSKGVAAVFREIILQMAVEKPIAILIDEYDKPIIDYLDDIAQAEANRDTLKAFYSVLKNLEKQIHLLFITGVSKFSKVSIFSDLNHLEDISMEEAFSPITGFTQQEVVAHFGERIGAIASEAGISEEAAFEKIRAYYNGYTWDAHTYLYNPFSMLSFLKTGQFNNYWFETGTPTFLIKHIRRQHQPEALEGVVVRKGDLSKFDLAKLDPVAVMFQTGYLTVKKIEGSGMDAWLTLGYPNGEVRFSFEQHLLAEFAAQPLSSVNNQLYPIKQSLEALDAEAFVRHLKSFFASIPFDTAPPPGRQTPDIWEGFFHALVFLLLRAIGLDVRAEVASAKGRSDAVVLMPGCIWIIEFKLGTACSAMNQILKQGYADPYLSSGKPIMLLGLGFDSAARNVKTSSWKRLEA